MGLRHVVITSVDRDDLPDRGAGHFAATIRAIRRRTPGLRHRGAGAGLPRLPDRRLRTVLEAEPDVFNHNIETVERFYRRRRPKGDYRKALDLLDRAKQVWAELHPDAEPLVTKSGIIVGMGETDEDVVAVMRDLRAHRVDVVTIGQYLQPTERHLPLDRWVTPEQFDWMREQGEAMGFASVFAGPLVRSSYHAEEQGGRDRRLARSSDVGEARMERDADGRTHGERPARAGTWSTRATRAGGCTTTSSAPG